MANNHIEYYNIDLYLEYIVPLEYLVAFSLTLFFLSLLGVVINKQASIIVVMIFFELMLYSLSFLVIIFSLMWGNPQGQIFALLIMCIAVAEASIGLGILISIFRLNQRIELNNFSFLKS